MAGKDFEGELIKTIEELTSEHANGALRFPSLDARIEFLFGAPYHAITKEAKGLDALDVIIAAALKGSPFAWELNAPVDRENPDVTLSSLRLIRRIKDVTNPPAAAAKPGKAAAAKPVAKPASPVLNLALVAEKLPMLPAGGDFPHDQKSIPAILFHLSSGVIEVTSPTLRALVIVVDGRLVDAVAIVQDQVVSGAEALDAITVDSAKTLSVHTLDASVASVLPLYWKLPVRVRDLQAKWIGGAAAVQGFIKPDARGVISVRTDEDTALIFFSQGQVLLAYSQLHPKASTDLATLVLLFNANSAVIAARIEDEIGVFSPNAIAPAPVTPPSPVAATPTPLTPPSPIGPTPPVEPKVLPLATLEPTVPPVAAPTPAPTPAIETPAPIAPPAPTPIVPVTNVPAPVIPPPSPAPIPVVEHPTPVVLPVSPVEAMPPTPEPSAPPATTSSEVPPWAVPTTEPNLDPSVLARILTMVRSELQGRSLAVESEFSSAELTRSGLLKAAKRVRAMRPRLVSEERMESVGTRAINIITGREAAQ